MTKTNEMRQAEEMNITDLERLVLNSIALNDFRTDRDDLAAPIWADCIDNSPIAECPTGRSLSGVVSSLVKKGLVGHERSYDPGRLSNTDDSTVWLTAAGIELIYDHEMGT
jgi:hypothetical protein